MKSAVNALYPSRKRLARILLLHAQSDWQTPSQMVVVKINYETLRDMVATMRSRVCFLMEKRQAQGLHRLWSQRLAVGI